MNDGASLYEFLLVASFVVFAGVTALYLKSDRASLFHPATVYLAFHFIVFVLRPVFAYINDYDLIYQSFDFMPSWSDKITVLLAVNLGLLVYVPASLYFGNARPRFATVPPFELDRYVKPLLLTCVVAGIPGVLSLRSIYQGGYGQELDFATGTAISTTGIGYLNEAQLMLASLVAMIAYVFRFRWWSLLPFAAFVMFRAGTGGRGPFVAAVFLLVLLYLFQHRRRWLTAATAALAVVAFALFRLVGDDRGAAVRSLLGIAGAEAVVQDNYNPTRFLESMDWANLEFFEYIVYAVPQRTGTYGYFASLLQIFTEPIPRILWEGKPIGSPVKFFNLFDYGRPFGGTYSLPGSGWLELGWIGVFLMCLLFAAIYGIAYNRFMNSRQTPFAVMLFGAFAMSSITAFRDGLLITVLRQSIFYLAPVLIMQLLAMGYARSAEHSAPRNFGGAAAPPGLTPRERRKRAALASTATAQ